MQRNRGAKIIAATAYCDVQRLTCAEGSYLRICKANVFREEFGVNSAFNATVFGAPLNEVTMEFVLFRRGGKVIGFTAG